MTRADLAANGSAATSPIDRFRGLSSRHRLLALALLVVVVFHGSLLFSGSYQRTYDAYVHIFFADHYARSWFSGWDTRWYTGFSTVSYPPGAHQLVAAASQLVGLRTGFVLVQLGAVLLLTVGVFRWAGIWVEPPADGWAAVAVALCSSIAETVHVFGQLPTTISLGFLLNALPFAYRWTRDGRLRDLVAAVGCTMATTACHHVTTLFGAVFFVGPVLVAALLESLRTPLPGEPTAHPARVRPGLLWPLAARRLRRAWPAALRGTVFAVLLVVALVGVVLPYWLHSRSDPITQVSIPHASRDSFLVNLNAGLVFWLVPWGTTLLVLPYALIRGFASRIWPLAASLAVLAFLGTGGTTPLPRMLLGGAFDILTLDRFTFWATICVLPLVGVFLASATGGTLRRLAVTRLGRGGAAALGAILVVGHVCFTLWAANLTHYRPFQPAAIDPAPITAFLSKDDHDRWRYLTLGFGDQMAWLSANTTAATVDGNYHSARALPELTSRPVERLENSKYAGVPGIGSLQQFLAVPERYQLKYVFSNDRFYDPLLDASGWTELGPLENGIVVWERADVPPLPATDLSEEPPGWQRALWGVVPPTSIALALALLGWTAAGMPVPQRPPRGARRRTLPNTVTEAIDQRLARSASRVPRYASPEPTLRWLPGRAWVAAVRDWAVASARRAPAARRAATAGVLVIAVVVGTTVTLVAARPRAPGPDEVIAAYYDALDFRRFDEAYALLDPATRPDRSQYQLDQTADGGLVASYGKLDAVRSAPAAVGENRVQYRVTTSYLTSLQAYDVQQDVTLRRVDRRWLIVLPPAESVRPVAEFDRRPQLGYVSQGRRRLTSGATSTADVLDRPQLQLAEVRALRVEQRWVVIGRVVNADVDPADVTVTADLRDPNGLLLATWNASQVMVHKLAPGQSTPFRLEFQSIAGTGAYGTEVEGGVVTGAADASLAPAPAAAPPEPRAPVEFDPRQVTPLVLPDGAVVGSVAVSAKAVVTPVLPPAGLQLSDVRVSGQDLVGSVRNDGTAEVAIPHLVFGYRDAAGRLAWVDHAYLEHSVPPQRSVPFQVRLRSTAVGSAAAPPVGTYAGPLHTPIPSSTATLAVPGAFAAVDVAVSGYQRREAR